MAAALAALYVAVTIARFLLARRYAAGSPAPAAATPEPAAILQPILSGDPALPSTLAANARALPNERLYWLVDDDDPAGHAAAHAAACPNVRVISAPPPRDGENPKLAKLARILPEVPEPIVVVLDDDTRIDAPSLSRLKAALGTAALVTGLPVFTSNGSVYERFIGGFVNGNALLTYLPAAAAGAQHTINGMIYAARTADLRALGGFAAIAGELTDDYAMAQLFERAGRPILQTPIPAAVGMTVRTPSHCARVLRRWFLFANRYLRENLSPATLLLVALPALLPLAGLLTGGPLLWLPLLLVKALLNRILLYRVTGSRSGPVDLAFEMLADTLSPFFYATSLYRPQRLSWRTRRIAMDGARIRYR
jgi:ceramide glucosyltransferase